MKVLVFGGSFSPPTLAHEEIIDRCLSLRGFDEVWLLPSADRLDKTMSASNQHRLNMLELIKSESFNNNPRLKISTIEFDMPTPVQFYKTERALTQQDSETIFYFAFGGDAYNDMPGWGDGERLKKQLNMVVFSDHPPDAADSVRVMHVKLPAKFSNMSSSLARKLLAGGGDVSSLLSWPIIGYVAEHGLYK